MKRSIIVSNLFNNIVIDDPVLLIDAGARGNLDEPWKSVDSKAIRVIGFEPDKKECQRLNNINGNSTYFPTALWSSDKKIKVYLTKTASCSSVYKPNFNLIKKYQKKHWEPRLVKKILEFPTTTLDNVLTTQKLKCDFLKIDTQGAEYEILRGADKALEKDIFGILLESWTTEVYKDQILAGDILKMMHDKGFSLFDINIAAAWQREIQKSGPLVGKSQIIGLDFLFLKEPKNFRNFFTSPTKLTKAAAIAEVYGFPDYALEIIEKNLKYFPKEKNTLLNLKEIITVNAKPGNLYYKKIKKLFYMLLGIKLEEYPSLHY